MVKVHSNQVKYYIKLNWEDSTMLVSLLLYQEQYKFVFEAVNELFERHLDIMKKHAYENITLPLKDGRGGSLMVQTNILTKLYSNQRAYLLPFFLLFVLSFYMF